MRIGSVQPASYSAIWLRRNCAWASHIEVGIEGIPLDGLIGVFVQGQLVDGIRNTHTNIDFVLIPDVPGQVHLGVGIQANRITQIGGAEEGQYYVGAWAYTVKA